MSRPFIIWTMQRTGGTALTDLLMEMSEHRSAEHEPFNWAKKSPRQFWPITDAWNKTRDHVALAGDLDAILAQNVLLKHCYELLQMPFNQHLMQAAAKTRYRHIHLLRRDETARLTSKFIAESQGTWFRDYARKVFAEVADGQRAMPALPVEDMVRHFRHCRSATETVSAWLADLGAESRRVYYEDLYEGDRETRLAHLLGLLNFLGFTQADVDRHRFVMEAKIFHAGQETRSVAPYVPNLAAARAALAAAGCEPATDEPATDGAPARQERRPMKPAQRMVAEFRRLVERHAPQGPFLELGLADAEDCAVAGELYAGAARHAVGQALQSGTTPDGIVLHQGELGELAGRFTDGQFNTVLWNDAIVHDRCFWRTLEIIRRLLAPDGVVIFSVPGFSRAANQAGVTVAGPKGQPIPDTTPTYRIHASPDFWRISPQAMRHVVLDGYEVRDVRVSSMPPRIFGVGVKRAAAQSLATMSLAAD